MERIIEKIKILETDPLAAASEEFETAGFLSLTDKESKSKKKKREEAKYETVILENAITKIGHLLALGFGEAGSKIIGENIRNGGDLDPMMTGNKIISIFGFCDIQ